MFKDVAKLREQIKVFGLERHEETIVALAKPAIRMLPRRVDEDEIPLGTSKLDGNPDLPADFEWKYYEGKPLTFIGQFKLSEIAPCDRDKELPAEGMLYFFYDREEMTDEFGTWQFEYLENENTELQRKSHPQAQGRYVAIRALPSHRLNFETCLSLPIVYEDEKADYDLQFTEDEHQQYWGFYNTSFPEPRHSLLGYPSYIQYYPQWTCVVNTEGRAIQKIRESRGENHSSAEMDYIKSETENWKFLLQIDTDDSLNVMWGDAAMLYTCIRKDRLAAKSFEKCITLMQCS
jgi:uncharacterized protein YwqG